jgi:hypothetical protein
MVSKTTYKLRLNELIDTSGLDTAQKEEIKEEIAEYIYDSILKDTSEQKSAVTGKKFKALSKDYKKIKSKIALGVANLELTGDMLNALEYKTYRDGIEIGIFDPDEAQKSDNHNKFSAKSRKTKVPERQFIPRQGETFRAGIIKEVTLLAEELKDDFEDQ